MSVVIETTVGDVTVDLFLEERPRACLNFLKLCKIKYYNYNLFHTISRGFIAQTGDPTGSRTGGESIYGIVNGPDKRYFASEKEPRIKHTKMGFISFVGDEESMIGSQFFFTLGEDLTYLDPKHCVFGEVVEGFDILEMINETICDTDDRPYQDVRITHTVILDDPYPDPNRLNVPSRSPSPTPERLRGGRIAPDEEIDEMQGKSVGEVVEMQAEREAKARATILEMVGDIPDAEMAPPENVLFVCKLNPITTDDDLEIIFNRFGKIKSCEVIRDKKTGDSLQYAFIEFEDQKSCEDAYFKMDNILIDDRRIHVDFSQSVSKIKWHGKGRGVTYINSNKTDKFPIDDPKRNINLKGSIDRETTKNYRETSKNDHNNGKNRTKFDYKSQGNRSDYRYRDSYKYKEPSRDEHRRRSRSVSQNRSNSRNNSRSNADRDKHSSRDYYQDRKEKEKFDSRFLQVSRNDKYSSDKYKHYKEKKRYEDVRESKFKQSYSSRDKTYDRKDRRKHSDSMDDEKNELKMKQSSAKRSDLKNEKSKLKKKQSSRPKKYDKEDTTEDSTDDENEQIQKNKNRKKPRKDETDSTDSSSDKKRRRKRKQEVSHSESEVEYKKRKEKASSHKETGSKYKGEKKKSKKVETSSSSDSSDSTDSSDSEVDKKSKKKSKLKSRKDSSSDSANYKKRKSKKR